MRKLALIVLFLLMVALTVGSVWYFSQPEESKQSYTAEGADGVLYSDYFSNNAAKPEWTAGLATDMVAPETVNNSLRLSGTALQPCAAMLMEELPNRFDIYFTVEITQRGGDSRDPGVFFCVGGDINQRYQLLFSEEKLLLRYNGTTEVAVKKVEELKAGAAYSFRLSVYGAKLQVYFDGEEEPRMTFNASGDFETFMDARYFGVISYARETYFDNLLITNGEDLIPVEEIAVRGKDAQETLLGLGNSLQMQIYMNPSNASDRALVWSVDNEEIASITQDGLLTAKGYGVVTVTARTRDGSDVRASCQIRIGVGEKVDETIISTNRPNAIAEQGIVALKGKEPDVFVLSSGRILVTGENDNTCCVAYSDDTGATWTAACAADILSGRIFQVDDKVYLMGEDNQNKDLVIYVSEDDGENWSGKYVLDTRNWHSAPSEVIFQNGCVYMTMEVESANAVASGYSGDAALAPILMRATVGSDLTAAESWAFSSELAYADIFKNGSAGSVNFVDVPNNHGDTKTVGWADGNVFQIYDYTHRWYDASMKTFYIYLQGNDGAQGYGLLLKVTEDNKGNMRPSLVKADKSGKNVMFLPMPGGNDKFNIVYDEQTANYWLVSNYMNDDSRVAIYFSKNAHDWCFAGFVAKLDDGTCGSPSIVVDGDDLLVAMEQSADSGESQILVYRVKAYAELMY